MNNPVRVALVPVEVPADPRTRQDRRDAAQRLNDAGLIPDPATGEVNPSVTGWLARINGAEVPVAGYAIEQGDGPQVMLSLVVPVDALTVGDVSLAGEVTAAQPDSRPKNQRQPWGAARRDPRDGVPGWSPEPSLGAQVAGNAEAASR